MNYRLATPEDIPPLVQMRWEFTIEDAAPILQEYDAFTQSCSAFLARALANGRWAIWLAETNGEIVAHIYLQVIEKVPRPDSFRSHYAYMTNVYARPAFRGQGIGSRLLQDACRWARDAGMEFIIVWPSEESVAFYARGGFRPVADAMELPFE